jgi:hypothetical protein
LADKSAGGNNWLKKTKRQSKLERAQGIAWAACTHPPNRLSGRMKHNVEEMRKQAPTDPMHVMKGTGEVAANKLDETSSLGASASIKAQRVAPPTNLTHVMKGTGEVAANKLDETTSLGGIKGGAASIRSMRRRMTRSVHWWGA